MNSQQADRRRFLQGSAALAGLAGAGVIYPASAQNPADRRPDEWYDYGVPSRFVRSKRIGTNGRHGLDPRPGVARDYGFRTPLQDVYGTITPASLHFIINHGYDPPDINPAEHRLMIHGLVDRPLMFTFDELLRMPSVTRMHFVECAGNSTVTDSGFGPGEARMLPPATAQVTHGLTSCSEWTGVPLSVLLEQAGVKREGTWFVAEGAEQGMHMKSIPIAKAMEDALVVYGQNGEPIRPEQGFPLRLLTPGYEGINNVKWLRRIKVVDQPYMGMRESTKYPSLREDGKARWFQFELGPKSVITRPSGGQHLAGPGFYEITGLAWSGGGKITKVEISTDGGRSWQAAEVQGPVHSKAHTRFRFPWSWNGSDVVIQSRCTDDRGDAQPSVAELGKFIGVTLSLDYFKDSTLNVSHFNAIQPWRVKRDGSVENAIFV